jgi:hypothetical protein
VARSQGVLRPRSRGFALGAAETGGITSSFVPRVALVDFLQWKNSEAKGHIGWFFLGVKEGCK